MEFSAIHQIQTLLTVKVLEASILAEALEQN